MSKPRTIVMTFGRFNPPTAGHHLLAGTVMDTAKQLGAEHRIYGSVTQDPKKNPLTPKQKSRHMRRVLGTRNVVVDPTIVSPFHALKHVSDEGYENVIMITGSDREAIFDKVPEYQKRGDFKFKTFLRFNSKNS
jgi:nicotinic acid mononucleotide adenylyltransferase